jgi:hypothetical protein
MALCHCVNGLKHCLIKKLSVLDKKLSVLDTVVGKVYFKDKRLALFKA